MNANAQSLMFEERSFYDWEIDTMGYCHHVFRKSLNCFGCPQYKCQKCQETKESDPDEDREWWDMEALQAGLRSDEYYKRGLAAISIEERDKYFECCSKDRTIQAKIQSLIRNPKDRVESKNPLVKKELQEVADNEIDSDFNPPDKPTKLLLGELPHSETGDTLLGELPQFNVGDRVFWQTESRGFVPAVIEQLWVKKAKICTVIFERVNVAIADLVPFNEKHKPSTVGENNWNPEDFGETPMKAEEDGQLTIFFDDSIEPRSPDDYPDTPSYEKAWLEWKNNHKSENVLLGGDLKSQVDQIEVLLKAQFEYDLVKALITKEKETITELILAKFGDNANSEAIINELITRLPTGKPLTSSLGSLVENIDTFDCLTDTPNEHSKKQRTFGHGSGYIFKKTCQGKYPQWWFQTEEKGKKHTYYIPKNKLSTVKKLNDKLVPVKDILKALGKG